jgi:hypothetical protein
LSENSLSGSALAPLSALPRLHSLSLSRNKVQATYTVHTSGWMQAVHAAAPQCDTAGLLYTADVSSFCWVVPGSSTACTTTLCMMHLHMRAPLVLVLVLVKGPHPHLTASFHHHRLQHLEGLPGITGGERSAEEALVGAGINPGTAFPALEVLDLSDCGVRSALTVDPLRSLPRLRRLLLAGNPLAHAAIQVGQWTHACVQNEVDSWTGTRLPHNCS